MIVGINKLRIVVLGFDFCRQCLLLACRPVNFLLHNFQVILRTYHLYLIWIVRIWHLFRALLRLVKSFNLLLFLSSQSLNLGQVLASIVGALDRMLRQSFSLYFPQILIETMNEVLQTINVFSVEHFIAIKQRPFDVVMEVYGAVDRPLSLLILREGFWHRKDALLIDIALHEVINSL